MALAVAGTGVQAVCRNPLAEPGLLGVTGGAGIGAVWLLVERPESGVWLFAGVGSVGALLAFAAVLGLSWRGGLASDRLVLVGYAPYQTNLALTWLAGTTYGRTFGSVLPVSLALLVVVSILVWRRRELDLLAIDDDLPCTPGVGLIAPHMARALVGARSARVIPVSLLIGALLVSIADVVGRTVIAPSQIPVGIMTALLGDPYFVYLL